MNGVDAAILLADHASKIEYEDLPSEAVEITKKSVMDTLGVILAGSTLGEGCQEIIELVKEAGGKKESSILSFGGKVPAFMAAFANGAMSHVLDYDDVHDGAILHPTAACLPAVLAVAEKRSDVTGKEFIAAVALGNDITSRLGLAVPRAFTHVGWLSPMTLGVFGAATAAGKILRLDQAKMVSCISLALTQAGGSAQVAYEGGSMVRGIRDAFTAKAGVLSSILAQQGVRGCQNSLEGKAGLFNLFFRGDYDPDPLTRRLGKRFEGTNVAFKPYPSCRQTHPFIDAAINLAKRHGLKPENMARIVLTVGNLGESLCFPEEVRKRPASIMDAKFSLPYAVAVSLVYGKVGLANFTPSALQDAKVLELATKVICETDSKINAATGIEPGILKIECQDRRVYSERVLIPYGSPQNPMTLDAIISKFKDCVSYSAKPLPQEVVNKAIDLCTHLEEVDNVNELVGLLS